MSVFSSPRRATAPCALVLTTATLLMVSVPLLAADDGSAEAPAFHCSGAAEQPLLRRQVDPKFPPTVRREAYKYRRPGQPSPTWQVTTRFDIDADGKPINISSSETDPAAFAQHANNAVWRWRFDPPTAGTGVAMTGCERQFTFAFPDNVARNRSSD